MYSAAIIHAVRVTTSTKEKQMNPMDMSVKDCQKIRELNIVIENLYDVEKHITEALNKVNSAIIRLSMFGDYTNEREKFKMVQAQLHEIHYTIDTINI